VPTRPFRGEWVFVVALVGVRCNSVPHAVFHLVFHRTHSCRVVDCPSGLTRPGGLYINPCTGISDLVATAVVTQPSGTRINAWRGWTTLTGSD